MDLVPLRLRGLDPDHQVWVTTILFGLLASVTFAASGLSLALDDPALLLLPATLIVGIGCAMLITHQPQSWPARASSAIAQHGVIMAMTVLLAFSVARIGRPLIDVELLRFDQWIGYDWTRYAGFVADHPDISTVLELCYISIFIQPVLAVIVLSRSDLQTLRVFLLAQIITLFATVLMFAWWPSTVAWQYLHLDGATLLACHIGSSFGWTETLLKVRSGHLSSISLHDNFAIIGFPSYHTAAAILNVYALGRFGRWRWLVLPLNIGMIAAAPIWGGHYLADIMCGAVVAVASLMLLEACLFPRRQPPEATPPTGLRRFWVLGSSQPPHTAVLP